MEQVIKNYVFNPDLKTVTLTDYTTVYPERISVIFNQTRNVVLYDTNNTGLALTVAGNVITLGYGVNSSRFAATDKLRIVYSPTSADTFEQPTYSMAASGYPPGATPLAVSSGNVAAATASATLAKATGKTTYITGFTVSGSGAVAGLPVTVTVAGILGGTLSYTYTAAIGVLLANTPLDITFPMPVPASATNTDIVVSCPTLSTGATNNTVTATGFRV